MIRNLAAASLLLILPAASHAATVSVPISFTAGGGANVSLAISPNPPATQPTMASGTIEANVTIDITNPGAPFVATIQFLGGETIDFTDVSFAVGFIPVNSSAVKGDFTGSATVAAGNIADNLVSANLNDGGIDTPLTGANPDIDLNLNPLTSPVSGGTISLSNINLVGNVLTFDSNLTMPINFIDSFQLLGGAVTVNASVVGDVTGSASGIQVVVPEPNAAMLLVAASGLFAWRRRR